MIQKNIDELKFEISSGIVYWHPYSLIFRRVHRIKKIKGIVCAVVGDDKETIALSNSNFPHISEFVTVRRLG